MDRDDALGQLSRVHALALRLYELGATPELIAECLGLDPEAVAPLLQVAAAKLSRLEQIDLSDSVGAIPPVPPVRAANPTKGDL